MSKYTLAVFDMDGTILNTLEDLADNVNYALRQCGFPERTIGEVRQFVGNGIRKLVERAVPEGTGPKEQEQVFLEFHKRYKVHSRDKTRPYPGILELLRSLRAKGIKTAVVSNKADYAVQDLAEYFFPGLFSMAVGEKENEGIRKKPAPDSVYAVLEALETEKEKAVYIGDSDVDIATAENAGIDCIVVTWGFRDEDLLKERGAKILVSSSEELFQIITE